MRNILYLFLICLMIFPVQLSAQRKGSRDLGGGVSFVAPSDSATSQLFVFGVLGYYFDDSRLFELEPIINAGFIDGQVDLTGFIVGSYSFRVINMAMGGDYGEIRRDPRRIGDEAGVFFSAGGGFWLDSFEDKLDSKIYSAPLISVGIGTRSNLGSLTSMRTQVKYFYNFPQGKEHIDPWSTILVTTSFSVFTKL